MLLACADVEGEVRSASGEDPTGGRNVPPPR